METPDFVSIPPKTIIFDLDDTLYDYLPPHQAGLEAARKTWGRLVAACSESDFQLRFKAVRDEVHSRLHDAPSSHNRLLGFVCLAERYAAGAMPSLMLAEQLDAGYWKAFLETMNVTPGVGELLDWCSTHSVKTGVLSDGLTHLQLPKLRALQLVDKIDQVVTSEEIGIEKPDPAGLDLLLSKLSAAAVSTWFIGDSLAKDVKVAKSRGLHAILCKQGVYAGGASGERVPIMSFPEILASLIAIAPA